LHSRLVVLLAVAACSSSGSKPASTAPAPKPAQPASAPAAKPAPASTTTTVSVPTKPGKPYDGPPIAAAVGVDVSQLTKRPSGLWVQDLTVGTGNPAQTPDFVKVNYTLWLANGTKVESTEGGSPLEIRLGQHAIIEGWEEGLTGMKPGGHRVIIVPPTLGYGMRTRGKIPGGSTLVFDLAVTYVGR